MSSEKEDEEVSEFLEHAKEDCIKEPRISLTTHYLNSLNLGKRPTLIMEKTNLDISDFKKNITKQYKLVADSLKNTDYISEDETNKIENHLKDLKYLSPQQISSVRYYFNSWKNIVSLMRQYGMNRSIKNFSQTSNTNNNIEEKMENPQTTRIIENNNLRLKSKESENNENQKLEKKRNKISMFGKKKKIEEETIYVIPRADILKYIPFCNDIVIPKKN